ncbi:hypothetical protein CEE45_13765 [Candidatus Heimdallarchaeota archaeon B3_Heim]|nr:MAG: hypothetical protein CEE45_13765 [Candidatus Heimdallarchaeota archaeon B3_Heim]
MNTMELSDKNDHVITPSGKAIETAYGKRRVTNDRTADVVSTLLAKVGFTPEIVITNQFWYLIKARKNSLK